MKICCRKQLVLFTWGPQPLAVATSAILLSNWHFNWQSISNEKLTGKKKKYAKCMIYSYSQEDEKLFVANIWQNHRKQLIDNTSIYENANPTVFCHKLLRQHHWNIKTTCWDDVSICKIGWIANSTNALMEHNRLFHSQFFYSQ